MIFFKATDAAEPAEAASSKKTAFDSVAADRSDWSDVSTV